MKKLAKQSPAMLITYLCTRCMWDFTRAENEQPKCRMCGKKDRVQETNREPLTPQAVQMGLMRSVEKLESSLLRAYDAQLENVVRNDQEEILLLQSLVKAKNLQRAVEKAFGGRRKRKANAA